MCYCCKKINSNYLTHPECKYLLNVDFVITEWIMNEYTKPIESMILKDGSYSLFAELLELINNREVLTLFQYWNIKYIRGKNEEANKYLKKQISKRYESLCTPDLTLLVGYRLENLSDVQKQIKEILNSDSKQRIGIFLLFTSS